MDFNKFFFIKDKIIFINVKDFKKQKDYTLLIIHIIKCISEILLINSKMIIIVECKKSKIKNFDIQFCKIIIKILQDTFPEKLEKCSIINSSIFFKSIFNIIKRFIDKETKKKIFIT